MESKTLIKVCGITRPEDAQALDASGVHYLGFNFWPGSKRYIEPASAAAIIARLKHAVPVGVFVDHSAAEINAIAAQTGIRWAQLHGSEGWDVLDRVSLPVIKAIPHDRLADWGGLRAEWDAHPEKQPRYFLVDTGAGASFGANFGGSGAVFDWGLLGTREGRPAGSPLPRPYFLAGGLGPANVGEAVGVARPFAVDLNSKVETSPGVKDVGAVGKCVAVVNSL
jgi:phosphoribosylanthranilate isomerase